MKRGYYVVIGINRIDRFPNFFQAAKYAKKKGGLVRYVPKKAKIL